MARYRRTMRLRPINRIKHVFDSSTVLAKATNFPFELIKTVDAPVLTGINQVETGSTVNAVYLRIEVASNDAFDAGVVPNFYLAVMKNPGDNLTNVTPNVVGADDNKKYVIHQEMIMINNLQGGIPRTLFNGVISIPKGYRRNGPKDKLIAIVQCPQLDTVVCVQCHYKEFR